MKKIIYFFIPLCILSLQGWGQADGDYRSFHTGNWNVAGNWEKYDSSLSQWVNPASEFPPLASPWISKRVTIQSGHTITVATGATAVGGITGGVLEISSGGTLNMGTYTIRGTSSSNKFPTVTINGTLNTSTYVTSDNFTIGSGGHFITSYGGSRGWWYSTYSPTSVTLSGEIRLIGTASQVIPEYTYNNIVCTGSTKTLRGPITVNGLLTINSDATLDLSLYTLSFTGSEIIVDGVFNGAGAVVNFDGGTQAISGTGTFGDAFDAINIGASSASYVALSNPNLIAIENLTITASTSSTFIIGSSSKVDVNASLVTGDGLTLKASESEPYTCASLNVSSSVTVSENTNVELFLTGGGSAGAYKWHYISSPFTSLPATNFTSTTSNIARYDEGLITVNKNDGWIKSNGYIYSTGGSGSPWTGLLSGRGYNHWFSENHTYTLSGTLRTTTTSVSIKYNSAENYPDYPDTQGFNLLGNPFSCSLDWGQIDDNLPAPVSWAIYFTTGDGQYASWINGVGTGGTSSVEATGTIPPMQGFFVKTVGDASVTLLASAKVHSTQARYKGIAATIPLVRLKIENQTDYDDAVVRFDDKATTEVDNSFDAYKFSNTGGPVCIWTSSGNVNYSINGLPFPETSVEIPVGIYSLSAGNLKISGTQIDGLENYNVMLVDKQNNLTIDLKKTVNLAFDSPSGIVSDRFVLKIINLMTAVPEVKITDKSFNLYSSSGFLNVQTLSDTWEGKSGDIKFIDITGKSISVENNITFSKDAILQIPVSAAKGILLVEIRSGAMRYVGKVYIKQGRR